MNQKELQYLIAFNKIPAIGAVRLQKIIQSFATLEDAWNADISDFLSVGFDENTSSKIVEEKKNITPQKEYEFVAREGISTVTIKDKEYPLLLKNIFNPPPLLYYRGTLKNASFSLAVVGTRKISSYGKEVTREITRSLASRGLTIVSGLALGVDAVAHQACIDARGITFAVLGSGLDDKNIYPSSNKILAKNIINSGGALISEYAPGTHPHKMYFPQRNRIISGLTLGTLVTEAPEHSGALITAYSALEQNREVFAVPGNIFHINSSGTHKLITKGAKLVTSADDILESLNLENISQKTMPLEPQALSREEEKLMEILRIEPKHIDEIIRESGLQASRITSALTILELSGAIKNIGNGMYRKI